MIDLYKNKLLKIDELISMECPIDDINYAFKLLKEGQVARSVIVYD
jgi:Zn-dependent alcohol dehydrogenase